MGRPELSGWARLEERPEFPTLQNLLSAYFVEKLFLDRELNY